MTTEDPYKRYLLATEELPADLVKEVQEALEYRSKVIAFHLMPDDPRMRAGEKDLPITLVRKVRKALPNHGVRCVYFPGKVFERIRDAATLEERIEISPFSISTETLEVAKRLASLGFTYQAIADAVGYSRKTIASFVESRRRQGTAGHHEPVDSDEIWTAGCEAPGISKYCTRKGEYPERRRVLAAGEAMCALQTSDSYMEYVVDLKDGLP